MLTSGNIWHFLLAVRERRRPALENSTEGGLKGGALSTLKAMVVSVGFMATSSAMFSNTPSIAGFSHGAMPLLMLFPSREDAMGVRERGTPNPAD